MFGKDPRISLIGPSSCRRTCDTGTIVSLASRRAERETAVYSAHPYFLNLSPAWVTIWSRGIGAQHGHLATRPAFRVISHEHLRRLPPSHCATVDPLRCGDGRLCGKGPWSPATAPLDPPASAGTPALRLQPTTAELMAPAEPGTYRDLRAQHAASVQRIHAVLPGHVPRIADRPAHQPGRAKRERCTLGAPWPEPITRHG